MCMRVWECVCIHACECMYVYAYMPAGPKRSYLCSRDGTNSLMRAKKLEQKTPAGSSTPLGITPKQTTAKFLHKGAALYNLCIIGIFKCTMSI